MRTYYDQICLYIYLLYVVYCTLSFTMKENTPASFGVYVYRVYIQRYCHYYLISLAEIYDMSDGLSPVPMATSIYHYDLTRHLSAGGLINSVTTASRHDYTYDWGVIYLGYLAQQLRDLSTGFDTISFSNLIATMHVNVDIKVSDQLHILSDRQLLARLVHSSDLTDVMRHLLDGCDTSGLITTLLLTVFDLIYARTRSHWAHLVCYLQGNILSDVLSDSILLHTMRPGIGLVCSYPMCVYLPWVSSYLHQWPVMLLCYSSYHIVNDPHEYHGEFSYAYCDTVLMCLFIYLIFYDIHDVTFVLIHMIYTLFRLDCKLYTCFDMCLTSFVMILFINYLIYYETDELTSIYYVYIIYILQYA